MSRLALCEHRHVRASCPTCNPEGAEEPTGAAVRVREKILRPVTDSLARAGVWAPGVRTAAESVDLLREQRDAERRFARRVQAWLAEEYGEELEHPACPPELRAAVLERMAGPTPGPCVHARECEDCVSVHCQHYKDLERDAWLWREQHGYSPTLPDGTVQEAGVPFAEQIARAFENASRTGGDRD